MYTFVSVDIRIFFLQLCTYCTALVLARKAAASYKFRVELKRELDCDEINGQLRSVL